MTLMMADEDASSYICAIVLVPFHWSLRRDFASIASIATKEYLTRQISQDVHVEAIGTHF